LLSGLLQVPGTPMVAPPDWIYAGALVYLSVFGSVIGFTTYLMLVARVGSGRAAYTTVLFPVVALVLSGLYEGYAWYWGTFAGVALTILGNVILFTGKPAAPRPAPQPPRTAAEAA
jgi:drug/metabolite transporter (DMT)-like permease